METRLEKRKKEGKLKRVKRFKTLIILLLFISFVLALDIVNTSLIQLTLIDSHILRYDRFTNTIDILGKSYIFDFSFIKKLLKRPVPWSFSFTLWQLFAIIV